MSLPQPNTETKKARQLLAGVTSPWRIHLVARYRLHTHHLDARDQGDCRLRYRLRKWKVEIQATPERDLLASSILTTFEITVQIDVNTT